MSKLINSYSFWRSSYPFGGLILLGEFRSRFSYCGRVFDMETCFYVNYNLWLNIGIFKVQRVLEKYF